MGIYKVKKPIVKSGKTYESGTVEFDDEAAKRWVNKGYLEKEEKVKPKTKELKIEKETK